MNEQKEQNAINPNNENNNSANNKTNKFNLIIGIATLLIAILGATFAYFSATARSAENDVTVKSAYVSISYDGGTEIKASNLIPSTLNVALKKYQKDVAVYNPDTDGEIITDYDVYKNDVDRKCVDAKGKEVCYVYQFSIESDGAVGETTDIIASIKINKNEFDNLSYMLYEVDFQEENGQILTDKYGFGIVSSYQIIRSNFTSTDTNPDNIDYVDEKFGKFEKPSDVIGDNGELTGTINPVACLFGYAADSDSKAVDDTARCAPYSVTNKEKHTYQLVIWLEETGEEQPEQGMSFEGTVTIEVSGGFDSGEYGNGQITGQE